MANHGYGFAGFIGFGKETTWGTAVSASKYVEALSEDLAATYDRYDTRNIIGAYYEPDDQRGIQRIGGSLVVPAMAEDLGFFLLGVMGVQSNTVVLSGALHSHEFTMAGTDVSTLSPRQPFTFEINRNVGSSQQYRGVNISQLQIGTAPNQELRVSMNLVGKAESQITATTPTFTTSPSAPFTFDTCSISVGGVAVDNFEAFQITINNQLEGVPTLNNTTAISRMRRTGPYMVSMSGTLSFEDIADYNDFLNNTERQVIIHNTLAASHAMTINIPRFIYTAFPLGIPGRERLTVSFEGKARYHQGSAAAIKVTLYNTTSGY